MASGEIISNCQRVRLVWVTASTSIKNIGQYTAIIVTGVWTCDFISNSINLICEEFQNLSFTKTGNQGFFFICVNQVRAAKSASLYFLKLSNQGKNFLFCHMPPALKLSLALSECIWKPWHHDLFKCVFCLLEEQQSQAFWARHYPDCLWDYQGNQNLH